METKSEEYSDPDFSSSEERCPSSPIEDMVFKRSLILERNNQVLSAFANALSILSSSSIIVFNSPVMRSAMPLAPLTLSSPISQLPPTDFDLVASVCYWISSKVAIQSSEIVILKALKFQLSYPTAKVFMSEIITKSCATEPIFQVSNVLAEVAFIEFKFVDVLRSVVAASAVAVS
jgi:hypothetical protein